MATTKPSATTPPIPTATATAALWQKLYALKPELPRHVEFQRRDYNGETWYILQDKATGRFHRFNPLAYTLLEFMDGRHTLDQILVYASQATPSDSLDELPTQEDLIELIQYLYVADLFICDVPQSTQAIFQRRQQQQKQRFKQLIQAPYSWRIKIFNPNALLTKLKPIALLLASPITGIIWLIVVSYALLQAGAHWSQITSNQLGEVFSPANLLLLWLIYPCLKVIHELGHGLFTKAWGGDVNEFGVVFILGTPLPYVDATSATGFSSKRRRLMVSAAGMAVELFFAAIALLLWINTDSGLIKNILFNIVLIGSVSTLFFNGNPLMRFDGYHLLCDIIDQPNLATHARNQIRYFFKRFLYGLKNLYSPSTSIHEALGLSIYGVLAFIYRITILVAIIVTVAEHFPTLGLVFALWILFFQIFIPLVKLFIFLTRDKTLANTRRRAILAVGFMCCIVGTGIFTFPFPQNTIAEGVLWLPDNAQVRSETSGVVAAVFVNSGDIVETGQSILRLINDDLISELKLKQQHLKEYEYRYQQAWQHDRAQLSLFEQELATLKSEVAHLQKQVAALTLRSASSGEINFIQPHELTGSFISQGTIVGLLVSNNSPRIRLALRQSEIDQVKNDTQAIQVRLTDFPNKTYEASISQEVPRATYTLPSPALGSAGGGRILVRKDIQGNMLAVERTFIIDVTAPGIKSSEFYGQKAAILFTHSSQSLFTIIHNKLNRLIIRVLQNTH